MEIKRFQTNLLNWYSVHQRKLPWRENHDPYRIWLSEIMLQQTQVATVIDYFNRFVAAYPNPASLAAASEDSVFKLWEGLGYYSRARNLMKCARVLVEDYDGQFPRTLPEMLKLPGIGPYTAGAVLSIAFNAPVPAVDGNVLRVFSRLHASFADIGDPKTRPLIEALVCEALPEDRRHFNQAVMELGATICTPRNPLCGECPVSQDCLALSQGLTGELPVKLQKIKKTTAIAAVAYVTFEDQVLLVKRHEAGLLSGLWAFPMAELSLDGASLDGSEISAADQQTALINWLDEQLGLAVTLVSQKPLGMHKHVFTHRIWHMTLWHFEAKTKVQTDLPEMVWTERQQIQVYALPTAFVKLIQKSEKGQSPK